MWYFLSLFEMLLWIIYPHGHLHERQNPNPMIQTSFLFSPNPCPVSSHIQIPESLLSINFFTLYMNKYDPNPIISFSNSQKPFLERKKKKKRRINSLLNKEKENKKYGSMQYFFIGTFPDFFHRWIKIHYPVKLAWQALKAVALLAPPAFFIGEQNFFFFWKK